MKKEKRTKEKKSYIPLRYLITVLLTVLEIVAIIAIVVACCYYLPIFYVFAVITQIACVVKIISSDDNPEYKAPWLLVVLVLPVAGFMLYFIFYSGQAKRSFRKRLEDIAKGYYKKDDEQILSDLGKENQTACCHAKMLSEIADSHVFKYCKQTYFSSGERMCESLLNDLERAEKFIYMEFFIIDEGSLWDSILTTLKRKAQSGVEVKLVYDDFGCMRTLPANYVKTLKSYGIQATSFSRLKPEASSSANNRSHRKIVIIDGFIGYTGGVNLADEYVNRKERFGHWKDCGIRIEGEAVWEFTELFMVDFGLNVKKLPEIKQNLYPECKFWSESGYVVPFGDGPKPFYESRVAKYAIQNMLDSATKYAYITTPYLIPDNDLCLSLERAAHKGVDVRIIVPHIPDKKIVFAMTKSYYFRLLKAGVKIYEYTPGFIHAKSYLVDDEYAIIGSVNLDYRSLAHNFENGVWMYKTNCIKDIREDIENCIEKSVKVTEKMTKLNAIQRLFRGIVRIFAPLM